MASVSEGGLVIHGENVVLESHDRIEVVDLTDRLMDYVRRFKVPKVGDGLVDAHDVRLFINESQKALIVDIKRFLEDLVARDRY